MINIKEKKKPFYPDNIFKVLNKETDLFYQLIVFSKIKYWTIEYSLSLFIVFILKNMMK